VRVLPLFLTAFFAAGFACTFLIAFMVDAGLAVGMHALAGVPRGVLYITDCLLRFAFHLLCGSFQLDLRVACPFAYLALHTSGRIVRCTFYSVLIHEFTSNLWLACVLGCAACVFAGGEMFRIIFRIGRPLKSDRASTRDQLNEQHHKSNHEKDVNKSSQGVRRNNAN
jgi:hypothetical protein